MRCGTLVLCVLGACVAGGPAAAADNDELVFRRGDANADGTVDMADSSFIGVYAYQQGPAPGCMNDADANHDGVVDGADAYYVANWFLNGSTAPPAPGPFATACSTSPSPTISCDNPNCP